MLDQYAPPTADGPSFPQSERPSPPQWVYASGTILVAVSVLPTLLFALLVILFIVEAEGFFYFLSSLAGLFWSIGWWKAGLGLRRGTLLAWLWLLTPLPLFGLLITYALTFGVPNTSEFDTKSHTDAPSPK